MRDLQISDPKSFPVTNMLYPLLTSKERKPLRIGIIAHFKYPIVEPFAGGLEMHTHLLASKLAERGHSVILFATDGSDENVPMEAICAPTELEKVGTAEDSDLAFFREHHAYLSLMTSLRDRDFDIIHNNSLHYLPLTLAATLPMPVITTLHTPPFAWLESGTRLCAVPHHLFVSISQFLSHKWRDIVPAEAVVLNGIDLEQFAFHPAPDEEAYLIWFGRIVPEKGLHFAIEAARLAGLPLRIAGPILNEEYYQSLIAPQLDANITYVGHFSHDKLSQMVGGSRAFVCTPIWDEPYGLVVAEALACGVPVAAFARGAIPEIIDEKSGVLAKPEDVHSLAEAITAALKLNRKDCRARAEQICDVKHMVDGYESIYYQRVALHQEAQLVGASATISMQDIASHG